MNNEQTGNLNLARFLATHQPFALAILRGSERYPDIRGRIMLYPMNDRNTIVVSRFEGLPVDEKTCAQRFFALHIHDGTACTGDSQDPFKNAGMHYNPEGCPHPSHAGDLPPIFSTQGRIAWSAVLTDRFSAQEVLGKAVILHRQPDDFHTQPSGNAGEKIACGVIERVYR